MTARDFTTDDIVVGVQIPGVYDGTCCWLLKDGRIINRMTDYGLRREQATREWIARHGDNLRAEWGITTDQPRQQAVCGQIGRRSEGALGGSTDA